MTADIKILTFPNNYKSFTEQDILLKKTYEYTKKLFSGTNIEILNDSFGNNSDNNDYCLFIEGNVINISDLSKIFSLKEITTAICDKNGRIYAIFVAQNKLKNIVYDSLENVFTKIDDNKKICIIEAQILNSDNYFEIQEKIRLEILKKHIKQGIKIPCPNGIIVDNDVEIGEGSVIMQGSVISGNTVIGKNTIIDVNCHIKNSKIGDNCHIKTTYCEDSKIGNNVKIGPFCNIRPNCIIEDEIKIGDFVEIKNSKIGRKTSVAHLTYIGDAVVGERVNFGCGTVTSNFDGRHEHEKNETIIGNDVFIGCNTNLVAPITVHDNAYIAAGSTLTEDVPENTLAIARSRQINKTDWKK